MLKQHSLLTLATSGNCFLTLRLKIAADAQVTEIQFSAYQILVFPFYVSYSDVIWQVPRPGRRLCIDDFLLVLQKKLSLGVASKNDLGFTGILDI